MSPLTASRLIQLLADHIGKHGDAPVRIGAVGTIGKPALRCWYDSDTRIIYIESE